MKPSRYLIIALFVFIVSLALHKIYDPDFWWQLASGNQMWKTHSVLRVNTFSFTYPEHDWLNVYWLYQLMLSWLWSWGHAATVTTFRLALVLSLAGLVLFGFRDRRQPLSPGETFLVALAWLLLAPRLTDRPELVSFVLLAAMIVLVQRRRWWWCVLLEIIWANVHGFFIFGVVILACAAICDWIRGDRPAARAASLATIAGAAASIMSPFGWRNWLEFPRLATTMHTLANSVDELVSPFHPVVRATDGTGWLLLVFLVLAAILFSRNWKKVRTFDYLIMAASLPLALTVRRGVPLFVLCALPALLAVTPRIEKALGYVVAIALCLALAFGLRIRGRELGIGVLENNLPKRAVDFVQQHVRRPVRLFNAELAAGDYLVARGFPVFADGRLEAYPVGFMREYFNALDDDAVFRKMSHDYDVTHALVVTTRTDMEAFAKRISSLPEWSTLYTDDIAMVLERKRE